MNMKKGYALFITLFLLLSMSAILSQILSITDKNLQESHTTQNYTQLFLLTKDIAKIVKNSPEFKDINSSKDFDSMLKIVSYIPILLDSDTDVYVDIEVANKSININSLKDWDITQKDIFLTYLRNKGMLMPEFFYNMLFDVLKPKSNLTDIKRDMPSFNSDTIYSWREFEKIEYYYLTNTKDYSIFQIPWRKIISFKGDKINANYLSCEEWYLLLADNSKIPFFQDMCRGKKIIESLDELPLSKEQIAILEKFGIDSDDKRVKISIKLPIKNKKDIISTFLYDIALNKVSNVSMAF